MPDDFGDSGLIVTVFDDAPGGWLPIGEFGKLHAELDAAHQHLARLSRLLTRARALWFGAGFALGGLLAAVVALVA